MPPDAEVTGMHIDANGHFFVNAMHPDEANYKATVGVINGVDWNNLAETVPELDASSSENDIWHGIRTSHGTYQVVLQSGDALSEGGVAGGIYAADDGNQLLVSKKPDYNAFVPLTDDGKRGYLYTAWEDRPAGISQVEIEWDSASSEWNLLNSKMLDLSSINGGWVLCFGSMSPWGSPLFSEELYFDDTEHWNDDSFRYHSDQIKLENYLGHYPNPYDYGYIVELENATSVEPDLVRHLAMGRFSHENAEVMPDQRTVYLTDDGYDTVLFKFIADAAGDLSAGTLYAAKVDQDSTRDSAITGFDVEWMEMASSSNAEIQTWIDDYDGITTDDYVAGQNAYISDEDINDWAEWRLNQDLNEDGAIGTAVDDRVAFLESRKAAAALGASDEWNKMEGVAFNENVPDNLYLAMSRIESAMSDGQGDIDVTQNSCGIVYRMTMGEGWSVNRIDPVISGGPYTSSAQYKCDVNNLAGPDNLLVLDDGRVLIGEDTNNHESNMVWLWGEKSVSVKGNETITVNAVNVASTPTDTAHLGPIPTKQKWPNFTLVQPTPPSFPSNKLEMKHSKGSGCGVELKAMASNMRIPFHCKLAVTSSMPPSTKAMISMLMRRMRRCCLPQPLSSLLGMGYASMACTMMEWWILKRSLMSERMRIRLDLVRSSALLQRLELFVLSRVNNASDACCKT